MKPSKHSLISNNAGTFLARCLIVCLIAALIAACSNGGDSPSNSSQSTESPTNSSSLSRIAPGTSWQWQLTGPIDTSVDTALFDIDLVETPQTVIDQLRSAGKIVICYFSAGTWESFRPDAADFVQSVRGKALEDFPDERWLDIRARDLLEPIMLARLDLAVAKSCDGVEADNVDGYANDSGFALSAQDQIDYNRWLASEAHARGLLIALKNDLDQIPSLVADFDFAINEQCFEFEECAGLAPFIMAGKAVLHVEYNLPVSAFCSRANALNFDSMLKDIDLSSSRTPCR